MTFQGETGEPVAPRRRPVWRALLAHPFVTLLVAGVLVGGGLRFVPATSASASGGQTACTAK